MPGPPRPRRALARDLTRKPDEVRGRFLSLKQSADVADLLELEWSQLYYITSRGADRYRYTTFEIPKKAGGMRRIQAPHPAVKILQRKLLSALELVYQPHPAAHGFVHGRDITTNAKPHQGKRAVLNVDLENFFPSITFPRIRGLFMKRFSLPGPPATVLARLCCNTGDDPDHLPQGAPTSPILSNMICHSMDHLLVGLARDHRLYYSRYADDLTFSTNRRPFPPEIAEEVDGRLARIGPVLQRVVEKNGFALNASKERLLLSVRRQEVTGLTVNRRVNLPRRYVRQLRGMLHAWHAHGYENAEAEYHARFDIYQKHAPFRRVVAGKLAFLRQVRGTDDRIFRRLYGWARELDGSLFRELPAISEAPSLLIAAEEFSAITASDTKELRRKYVSRMFAAAEGTLWVVDPGLRIDFVRDMTAAVRLGRVTEIRLLSRERPPGAHVAEFGEMARDLREQGLVIEWRSSDERLFHDRWIADSSGCVSMGGPLGSMYDTNPPFGQNLPSRKPVQFEQWWTQSSPLPGSAP